MKKLLTFLTLLTLFFTTAWAAQETYTFSDHYSSNTVLDGVTVNATNFSMTFNKNGGTAPQYYTTGTAVRWYAKNKMTISSTNTITAITFTFGSDDGTNEITADVGTYSNDSWSGSATSVVFTVGGTSKNRRLAAVTVTYTPSTLETCATPTFTPEPGTYYASQSVSISSTEGATIHYTTDGTNPTATTGTVYNGAITVDETTTIKAIATKQGYNNSSVETALYLIAEPVANGKATFNAVNDRGTGSITKSPITFACSNGVLNNGTEYRLFKDSQTTFSVEDGYIITKIEFTCTSDNPISGFESISGLTVNGNNGTWEGEAQSVTFIASEKQVRATLINVYFVESSTITVGAPSISFDDFTAGSTTVTATITAGTNATSTEYKIGEDGTYTATNGTVSIDLTSNASPITIYAKSLNGESESSEVHETFILPALSVGVSPASYTGYEAQSLEITANNNVGTATLTYKINDEEVQTYSTPISLNAVGTYNITAYATDQRAGGEQVTATATITITEQPSGETVTALFVAGEDMGTTTVESPDEMSKEGVTISSTNAALATAQYRLYANSITTISVQAGSKITKIEFIGSDTGRPVSKLSLADGSTGAYSVNNNTGTWVGEANSVIFDASAQVRCSGINVTYIPGEAPDVVEYYLAGDMNGWGNPVDPNYKFTQQQDGTYVLEKLIPDMANTDKIRFKIAKVVNGGTPVLYGGSGNGDYGINRIWNNTNDIVLGNDNDHQQAFSMPDCFNAIFTLNADNMTFSVEKPQLYLIGTFNNYVTPTNDNVNGAKEMTLDTENGGWTITDEFTDGTEFRIYDAWQIHHGGNSAWILEELLGQQLDINNNNQSIFHIVGNGNYTITINSNLTKLVAEREPEKYTATIASNITGGTVAFNASGSTTPLELTENTEVRVYVTPQTSEWELATLTYTVTDGSPVSFIENYNNVGNYYFFSMPAANVEINATFTWQGVEVTETTYALVTSDSDIEVGAKYIIVNEEYSKAFVKAYQSQGVDIDKHTTTITNALGIAEFVLGNGSTQGTYTFKCGDVYLYNSSSTSLDITGTSSTDNNWTISIGGAEDYFATITSSNNRIIYYFASGPDFRAYSMNNYSSNVKLYKEVSAPVEATLAEVIALGENADGKKYKIKDEDGLLGVYKKGTSVWFKDEVQAVDYQNPTPTTGTYQYYTVVEKKLGINKSEKDFAQNNWIEVVFPSEQDFTNKYVKNLTGTYSCENGNPKLTLTVAVDEENDVITEVPSSGLAYELNPYMAVNFAGNQTYTNNGESQTFFFSQPKAQEYAQILWAVWDGSKFKMTDDSDDNYYGFTGSFTINPELNAYSISGLKTNDSYNFKAIIRKSASKAGPYEVYPTDLNPDVPTAINGVVVNGLVKSVKYVNVAGMVSDVPFQGVNNVVTEYTDGSRTTSKMLRK